MIEEKKIKPLLLVFPFEVLAHYLRCLQLAKYLRNYYQIKFLHSSRYISFIEEAGFETFDCAALNAQKVMMAAEQFDFSWLNERELEQVFLGQTAIIEALQPAAVLGDVCPTLKMAAEKTGVAYLALTNGYMTPYYARIRKMPQKHPLNKYIKLLYTPWVDFLVKRGEQLSFTKIHKPFKAIRKRHFLSEQQTYQHEMEGDINLVCDLPQLFPQRNLPENYYFIPPLFYSNENGEASLVADRLNENKKSIFVSMGSTGNWDKVSFLNDASFYKYNIITAGDTQNIITGNHVIRNDFISPDKILPFVDLVICHGGNGTIYQSLSYGLPVLCKTALFEQEWNVDAIRQKNLGESLDDITSINQYEAIIENWINQKNNGSLNAVQLQIQQALLQFDEMLSQALSSTMKHNKLQPSSSC